jgi:putative membrane protein
MKQGSIQMRLITWIIASVFILIVVSFACLNAETVKLHYYLGTQELPLSVLLIGSLIIGMLIGLVLSWIKIIKLKIQLRRLQN